MIARTIFLTLTRFSSVSAMALPDPYEVPAKADFEKFQLAGQSETTDQQLLAVSNEDLRDRPLLAMQLLDQAVKEQHWPMVKAILGVYEFMPQADQTLVLFAKAGVARSEGDYPGAIASYRRLLDDQPDLNAVRLDLARSLFENHQYDTAELQFHQVMKQQPPEHIRAIIRNYLDRISSGNDITAGMNLSYVNDSNVNKASSDKYIYIGDRTFIRNKESFPQRGEGLWYSGNVKKDTRVVDQHAVRMKATLTGNSYWNNHRYDDIIVRYYMGYHYGDFRQQFALLPFYEKRWYGTSPYSAGAGIRGEYGYLLTPVWQWNQVIEHQKVNYDDRRYHSLSGDNWFSSTTLSHALAPGITINVGSDLLQQNTQRASESNRRVALRSGGQIELPWNISLASSAVLVRRHYEGENDIFAVRRKDRELLLNSAIWHRQWQIFSLVPKLNFSYKQVTSNISFYEYSQKNIFLTIERVY
ncbi:MAG: TPR repeat-containing protein [Candidatus Erwinia impunctatus]|nr:TPR repeat-containing protein [Culicoides impunctatus]